MMVKLLARLEKNASFWFLLITSVVFFFLRLPSLFEPYWYGDEGIYEVIGFALSHGRMLYQGIWDNKPPLLYLIYALFQGNQGPVRFLSLLIGIASVWAIFFLSKKLFVKFLPAALTTSVFAFLFGLPLLEGNIANSENFMLLPNILSAILVFSTITRKKSKNEGRILFFAGMLLGLSLLFKVVAVFDLSAFAVFIFLLNLPEMTLPHIWAGIKRVLPLVGGFFIPLIITILYFSAEHLFTSFIRSTFLSNIGYVNYGNQFIIPQGFLIFKTLLLAGIVLLLLRKRKHLSATQLFVFLWLAFSIYNALFSQRPYTHYILVLLPSFSLLFGFFIADKAWRRWSGILIIAVMIFTYNSFWLYSHTIGYYQNFLAYIQGLKTTQQYQAFFDQSVPRDYALAQYINTHKKSGQTLFLWGNSGQIYKLTDMLPPGRFIVAYHVTMSQKNMQETQKALIAHTPTYIIVLPNQGELPYSLVNYQEKIIINNAVIYEHTF